MQILLSKKIKLKARFFDVDSMNVVWHGNYVKYMEIARCELLDEIGYGYEKMKQDGFVFPIVKMDIKYIKPIFFNDDIQIEARLLKSDGFLKFNYEISSIKTGDKLSIANTSQMAVRICDYTTCFELPNELLMAINLYLEKR